MATLTPAQKLEKKKREIAARRVLKQQQSQGTSLLSGVIQPKTSIPVPQIEAPKNGDKKLDDSKTMPKTEQALPQGTKKDSSGRTVDEFGRVLSGGKFVDTAASNKAISEFVASGGKDPRTAGSTKAIRDDKGKIIGVEGNVADLSQEDQNALELRRNKRIVSDAKADQRAADEEETEATQQDTQTAIERSFAKLKESKTELDKTTAANISGVESSVSAEPGTFAATANEAAGIGSLEGIKIRNTQDNRRLQQLIDNTKAEQRRLDKAIKDKDREAEKDAAFALVELQEDADKLREDVRKAGEEESAKTVDFIDKMNENDRVRFLSNLTLEGQADLQSDFDAAGLPASFLGGLINNAKEQALVLEELKKNPDDQELRNKLNVLRGNFDKIKSEGGGVVDKDITGFTNSINALVTSGDLNQEEADKLIQAKLRTEAGLEAEEEFVEPKVKDSGASSGVRTNPANVIKDFTFDDKEKIRPQDDGVVKDSEGNVIGRITSQFGANHNDISGEKSHNGIDIRFTNQDGTNSGQVKALAAGEVIGKGFAEKTFGGYVQIKGEDGNILQYGHLNFDQLSDLEIGTTIGSGEVFANEETNPAKQGSALGSHTDVRSLGKQLEKPVDEFDVILNQIKAGNMTNTEISEARIKFTKAGRLDEFNEILQSGKIKQISEKRAAALNVPFGSTQFQVDDIVAEREAKGLGNVKFQGMDQDDTDKFVQFLSISDRIEKIKELSDLLESQDAEPGFESSRKFQAFLSKTPIIGGVFKTDELKTFQDLTVVTGKILAEFIKDISGAAVSEPEAIRLSKLVPSVDQEEGQFQSALDEFEREFNLSLAGRQKFFGFENEEKMREAAGLAKIGDFETDLNAEKLSPAKTHAQEFTKKKNDAVSTYTQSLRN